MALDPISSAFELGKIAIERFFPDKNKRAEEMRKLEELRQNGDLAGLELHVKLMIAQINVNTESAKHKSIFVAGARPAVIWVGAFSLAWSGIIHPLLTWLWAFVEMTGNPPPLIESGVLGAIVTGLLGVGGMRTVDKFRDKHTDHIGGPKS